MAFHNIKLSAKTQDTSSNLDKDIFTSDKSSFLLGGARRRSSKPRNRSRTGEAKRVREQKQCPVEGCQTKAINIPRHIREKHKDVPEPDLKK